MDLERYPVVASNFLVPSKLNPSASYTSGILTISPDIAAQAETFE